MGKFDLVRIECRKVEESCFNPDKIARRNWDLLKVNYARVASVIKILPYVLFVPRISLKKNKC